MGTATLPVGLLTLAQLYKRDPVRPCFSCLGVRGLYGIWMASLAIDVSAAIAIKCVVTEWPDWPCSVVSGTCSAAAPITAEAGPRNRHQKR